MSCKADPNYSLCRATQNRGEDAHTDGKFAISDKGAMEIMRLFFTPDEQLYNKPSCVMPDWNWPTRDLSMPVICKSIFAGWKSS